MSEIASPAVVDAAAEGIAHLAARALGLLGEQRRIIIGLAGSPGAGKTTLATGLVARINATAADAAPLAAHLPMDGFHLANSTLDRLGRRDRKGAIDTFDGWGYLALLRRLHTEVGNVVYAPGFDRTMDEGVTGVVPIEPATRIVVTEGNYLFADTAPWAEVADHLSERWFCTTGDAERIRRLIERHERHGRSAAAAAEWAVAVDGANALLVETSAVRADVVVSGVDARILSERAG